MKGTVQKWGQSLLNKGVNVMKKRLYIVGIISVFIIAVILLLPESHEEFPYQNPVFEPVMADPSIIRGDDGYYYAYGTEDVWDDPETKLVPIIKSKNLVDWEYVRDAFDKKPAWKGNGSIWAPHITKYKEKYYLYYSMSIWGDGNPGIGVAISDKPEGPFKDKGKLFTSEEIGVENSIDPYFFVDQQKAYLFWGSFHGIYGIELTEDGFTTKGEPFQIAGNAFEAPWIEKRDDTYYFFGSIGSCCEGEKSTYHVSVAKAESLKGPYLDQAGRDIMSSEGTTILQGGGSFSGPGHNAMIQDDQGKEWLVYHAIKNEEPLLWNGASRRPLMIDPLQWKDGWPIIEGGVPSSKNEKGPVFK